MEYLLSKEHFLEIQTNLYDSMEQILKDGKIYDIRYKLVGKKNNYLPPIHNNKMIATPQWRAGMNNTANVNAWLHEITSLKDNIIQELLVCLAYDEIFKEFDKNLNTNLKNIVNERERYFKLAINDLYSFRENSAFLIYEMFDRPKIKRDIYKYGKYISSVAEVLSKDSINFHKINENLEHTEYDKLKRINEEEFKPINEKEFKLIQEIFKRFDEKECNDIFEKYRHPFTHRSNPGIGCTPLETFNFEETDYDSIDSESAESKELLKKEYKDITEEELPKRDKLNSKEAHRALGNMEQKSYISLSTKKAEEVKVTFEKAKEDVLFLLELFIKGFKDLLEGVEMLKVEVEDFY